MLGSKQRPLPCEGSTIVCCRFLELANFPQTAVFLRRRIFQLFRRFTRVAARLLHKGEHQRDEIAPHCCSCRSPSMYALNGVEGKFSELPLYGVLGSWP